MAFWELGIFLLLAVTSTDCQRTYKPWDCQRLNSPCVAQSGGQCQRDGTCLCTNNDFEGYNCGLRKTLKIVGACSADCRNAGVCYNDNGQKCFCPPGYYGTSCERKRVDVTGCDGDTITLNINPHETGVFSGRIYVLGHANTGQCNINIAATGGLRGFTRALSLSTNTAENPCTRGLTTLDNGRIKRYSIVVQYDSRMITATDELHTAQCSMTANGQFVGFTLTGINDDSFIPTGVLTGDDVVIGHVPLSITITLQPNRTPLPSAVVRVATKLFLEISLTSTTTFTSLRLETLIASEKSENPTISRELVTAGCPLAVSNGVVVQPLERRGTTILVPFQMFKFLNFAEVYFRASVTLCSASNAAACNPAVCNGVANGFGRKKRESEPLRSGNVSTGIFVVSEGDNSVQLGKCDVPKPAAQETCLDNPTFVIVAAIVGLLLLVAIVILLLICFRVNRKGRKNTTVVDFPPPAMTKM